MAPACRKEHGRRSKTTSVRTQPKDENEKKNEFLAREEASLSGETELYIRVWWQLVRRQRATGTASSRTPMETTTKTRNGVWSNASGFVSWPRKSELCGLYPPSSLVGSLNAREANPQRKLGETAAGTAQAAAVINGAYRERFARKPGSEGRGRTSSASSVPSATSPTDCRQFSGVAISASPSLMRRDATTVGRMEARSGGCRGAVTVA
ncbi:hypothetical protein HPB50_017367 [Hyalomma asiaticum]|uniref:Uncharacterized protein n=1 Tax=Hyalomma asiaticum TaxID=266040 RepID=A0ACB7S5X4_HYAAI|nr:hypothetical protein HPB50_017367 [Hyalomma asiaticum]